MSPVQKQSANDASLLSVIRKSGVLALPVVSMIPFGLFGYRPRQLKHTLLSYVLNIYCVFIFLCTLIIGAGAMTEISLQMNFTAIFMLGFNIAITINHVLLIVMFYKKYNLIHLLKDITSVRECKSSFGEIVYVVLVGCLKLAGITFVAQHNFKVFLFFLDEKNIPAPVIFKINNPILSKIMMWIEFIIYPCAAWMSLTGTSFLVSVIAMVMTKEFKRINSDLEKDLDTMETQMSGTACGVIFCKARDQFFKRVSVVQKMDELFCIFIGYALVLSLGFLCWALNAIFEKVANFRIYSIPTTCAVAMLMILLPASTCLNSKVSVFQKQECIPIGCVPPARCRTGGVSMTETPRTETIQPGWRTPRTETPPDRDPRDKDPPGTETPQDGDPPGQTPQRPPSTETKTPTCE